MTSTSCLIRTDLSSIQLLEESASVATWSFAPPEGASEDSLDLVQERVNDAALWTRERLGSRSLGAVCLDVSETRCVYLKAPSAEAPVLAASFRAASEDWGDLVPTGTLEALRPYANGTNGHASEPTSLLKRLNEPLGSERSSTAVAAPVMHTPDTIARLWLDALDRMGEHPARVLTLWHAMAQAWDDAFQANASEDSPLTGVVLVDESNERVVWSWSRAGNLVVGGHTTMPTHQDQREPTSETRTDDLDHARAIVSRLALDWLSWASQLGAMPDRIVIVAPSRHGRALKGAFESRWDGIEIRGESESDPIAGVLRALTQREGREGDSASTCLMALTHRSSRRTRRRFRWTAAALVLLASAVSVLGYRLRDTSAELASQAQNAREASNARADALGIPEVTGRPTKLRALRSHLSTLQSGPDIELPPPPKPIFDELRLVLEALQGFAEDGDLQAITIDSGRQSRLNYMIQDVRRRSDLQIAMEDLESLIEWRLMTRVSNQTTLVMEGTW